MAAGAILGRTAVGSMKIPPSLARTSAARLPEILRAHFFDRCLIAEPWTTFKSEPAISTIGLPIYKAQDREEYAAFAGRSRGHFAREFCVLYDFILLAVQEMTGQVARLSRALALPGFHLITTSRDAPFWGGTFHRDQFHHRVAEASDVLFSGTLLLNAEPSTHGLDFKGDQDDETLSIWHDPGRVTLFAPDRPHRIGSMSAAGTDVTRITMQFHARAQRDVLEIFW